MKQILENKREIKKKKESTGMKRVKIYLWSRQEVRHMLHNPK